MRLPAAMTVEDGLAARDASAIADALLARLQVPPWDHWLLIRRSLREPSERAYYVVFASMETTLSELAGVAGLRWTIETCFGTAKASSASTTAKRAPGTDGTAT